MYLLHRQEVRLGSISEKTVMGHTPIGDSSLVSLIVDAVELHARAKELTIYVRGDGTAAPRPITYQTVELALKEIALPTRLGTNNEPINQEIRQRAKLPHWPDT